MLFEHQRLIAQGQSPFSPVTDPILVQKGSLELWRRRLYREYSEIHPQAAIVGSRLDGIQPGGSKNGKADLLLEPDNLQIEDKRKTHEDWNRLLGVSEVCESWLDHIWPLHWIRLVHHRHENQERRRMGLRNGDAKRAKDLKIDYAIESSKWMKSVNTSKNIIIISII